LRPLLGLKAMPREPESVGWIMKVRSTMV
jgi:hypothetical protein